MLMKLWARRISAGLISIVTLCVVTGACYEQLARKSARSQFPPPGRLVSVEGRRIQVDCRGSGSPVVVFEAGLDLNGALSWSAVHDKVAQTTRACAYSRAGILWSDTRTGPADGEA